MVAREQLLALKNRILPAGAGPVIELLSAHHQQLEMTSIILEHVPLLIIGRHGMIARLPLDGRVIKLSQPQEIAEALQRFFESEQTLYVFVNLPEIQFPEAVVSVIREVEEKVQKRDELLRQIDEALERRDRETFYRLAQALADLEE
ncbi:MAG: IDEAL domain-containing protein [Alicyclobacillaceae bacterium]|nr:IDEAL domain-containing protein [Alicyclobacillaceae bacterium]